MKKWYEETNIARTVSEVTSVVALVVSIIVLVLKLKGL